MGVCVLGFFNVFYGIENITSSFYVKQEDTFFSTGLSLTLWMLRSPLGSEDPLDVWRVELFSPPEVGGMLPPVFKYCVTSEFRNRTPRI